MDVHRVLHPVLHPTRFRWLGKMERDLLVMRLMDKYDTFVEPDEQLTLGQAFARIALARPD